MRPQRLRPRRPRRTARVAARSDADRPRPRLPAALDETGLSASGPADLAACVAELTCRLKIVEAHLQILLSGAGRGGPSPAPLSQAGPSAASRPEQLVGDFLRLAVAHCRQRWRLTDYACALHVSPGYLRAACHRVTGASPVQLVHECLMREARHRLTATTLSIGAIALELGFEDAAYFSRLFHAKSGVSPKQYRLSCQQATTVMPDMTAQ